MRVWTVNQHAYTPDQSAGVRHYSLARELIGRGHDALVIATSFYHKAHVETQLGADEEWRLDDIHGVPFLWIKTPPYRGNTIGRLRNMVAFTAHVWRRTGLADRPPPDVIIGSSPHLFAALAAERLAHHYGVPFVFETRDLWPRRLVETGSLSPRNPLAVIMAVVERYLYRRADHILSAVPVSTAGLPELAKHITERGASMDDVTWLPNGVDVGEPPAAPGGGVPTFLYAGAHSRYADLDLVLDAAGILKARGASDTLRIRLLGDGPEKARLVQRAVDEGLDFVRFDASVPKSEIRTVLDDADVCLMTCEDGGTARWATSPNKLFEYLAAGRPVLYSLGTTYSPVEQADAGASIDPNDPAAMADAMQRLAAMGPAERRRLGSNGRRYVEDRHSYAELGAKLESTLQSVVGASKSSTAAHS